jgi:hypothetical protein
MAGPLGGVAGRTRSAHHSTQRCRQWAPWEAVPEIRECPPLNSNTSMAAPLGGDVRDQGVPTINAKKCRRWGTWEAVSEIRERPPSTQKMLTVDPLGGSARDSGAPTINTKNVNGGLPGRRCWRFRSAHHQRKKYRWWPPWDAVSEIRSTHHQRKKCQQRAP